MASTALAITMLLCMPISVVQSQQVADSLFTADIGEPAWPADSGPRLRLDEAHYNFHKLDGRYLAFGRMASAIGFQVLPLRSEFSDESLRNVDVLVIANALNSVNAPNRWTLPTPSAFTLPEIAAVRRFVERGGGLVLVADHMPFAGAATELGRAIGVEFYNGFVFESYDSTASSELMFRRGAGLQSPAIPDVPPVDSVVAFTGSAFSLTGNGLPLMKLPDASRVWLPTVAWQFGEGVKSMSGKGLLQGAAIKLGKGRVVVLGEAAMLSAQRAGPRGVPMGMNGPRAGQNARFAATLLRWVSGSGF